MLTDNQRTAVVAGGNCSVTANAGAGKTRVLVERFVETLLATQTRMTEIVAITFTEKAASELRKKISAAVAERLRGAGDGEERRRLEYVRDNLASSPIGTIHSFCARLIREYPVEADCDAGFTILEGHDRELAEAEALRSAMRAVLAENASQAERNEVFEAVRMLGREKVEFLVRSFLRRRDVLTRLLEGPLARQREDNEILRAWKELITGYVAGRLDSPEWREAAASLLALAEGNAAGGARVQLGRWNGALAVSEKIDLYRNLIASIFTKKYEPRVNVFGKAVREEAAADPSFLFLQKFDREVAEQVEDLLNPEFDLANGTLLHMMRILLRLYARLVETYDARKTEQGQLDFDDLERTTIALLGNPAVREHAAGRYKHIMVDEFQDTNHSQYEILRLLLSGFSEGNLFIVGDPKQSIYGFRNADVGIFDRTRRELSDGANGESAEIVLPESFRLLSGIVLFINNLFGKLMTSGGAEAGIRYDALIRGRQNAEPGSVEFMILAPKDALHPDPDAEEDNAISDIETECAFIADRIAALRADEHPIYRAKEGKELPAPFQFGDAAILLRGRTHLKKIERALIERNIPYTVTGGIGYYQTQEVFDFLNYFRFLLNPHDDVALFGILRSPFFAVADAELFETSLVNREDPLWEKVGRKDSKSENLALAITTLTDDLRSAHTLPVPALIQRIVHRTAWNGTVAALPQGRQIRGNVEKLIELGRDFESQGYVMLYDFVQRLQGMIKSEEKEGQAVVESGNDAVRITTIHSAKGLEFPVVFVPFLNTQIRFDSDLTIEPGLGAAFPIRRPENFDKDLETPFGNFLKMIHRRRTLEEEKRIFYVACSRACDMLVLSGTQSDSRKGRSWLRWLTEAFPVDEQALRNGFLSFQETLTYLETDGSHYIPRTSPAELRIALRTPGTGHRSPVSRFAPADPVPEAPRFILGAPVGHTAGEFFSATHLRTYRECPAKYFLKIRLGLPEEPAVSLPFDAEEDPNDFLRGELEGTITHAVLQLLTSLPVDEAGLRAGARSLVAASTALPEHEVDEMGSKIVSWVLSFARSAIGSEILRGAEFRTEHTLSAAFGESFLTGTIDRIWKGEDGLWSLLDYKSDNIPLAEIGRRIAGYMPQMEVYAYLVSRFFRQNTVRTVLLFLRHPESPVEVIFNQERLRQVEIGITETILNIREGKFFNVEGTCSGCPYMRGEKCLISILSQNPPNQPDL